MEHVKLCAAYDKMPVCPSDFFDAKTQLIRFAGWKNSKRSDETASFLDYISNFSGCPVKYISTGVDDEDIIEW